MKIQKIIYWISTVLFSAMMLMAGIMYLTSPEIEQGFKQMGFPSFFRVELGIAKILGAICLSLPFVKGKAKEWVYAGFTINLISAVITHLSLADGSWTSPLLPAILLAVSYIMYTRSNNNQVVKA